MNFRNTSMKLLFSLAFVLLCGVAAAAADEGKKPLWELGVIGGGAYVPDYPAAGQNHFNGLAAPYVIYRGKFFRAGDKGIVRGRLFKTDRIDFDISLDGSFAAESDDNDARRGMPDLDYLGEVGPRLQITLAKAARDAKLDLELPLRAVFSTDFSSIEHRGYIFNPELAYQHDNFLNGGLKLKLSIAATFADEEMMEYLYGVAPTYATNARPAYAAESGYLRSQIALRVIKPLDKRIKIFGRAGIGLHYGASNEASPLFREDVTYSVGLGLSYSFWQSEQTSSD